MAKAFDRVEWAFLRKVLMAFGFSSQWIQMILSCVSTTHYSVCVNGQISGFFTSSRGLKQGDPLSPMLFIIMEDVLSRGITKMVSDGSVLPYKVPAGCVPVSHLLFADDVLIFTNGGKASLDRLMNFLTKYEEASGQLVSSAKSVFLNHKSSTSRNNIIAQATKFTKGNFPIQYLGVPLHHSTLTAKMFDPLIEKVAKKAAGWKSAILSAGGKLILIRHILTTMPIYLLSVLYPPKVVISKIQKVFSDFFWGSFEGKAKHHWLNWKKVSKPVEEGGVGIRDLSDTLKSLQIKNAWRLLTVITPWSIFMYQKYMASSTDWANLNIPSNHSPMWKVCCSLFHPLVPQSSWKINEGSVSFWYENWSGNGPLNERFNVIHDHVLLCQTMAGSGWDKALIMQLGGQALCQYVAQFHITFKPGLDIRIWPYSSNGYFSTKSAFVNFRGKAPHWSMHKWIWNHVLPIKISLFNWRLWFGANNIDTDFYKMGISLASKCSCCQNPSTDSSRHLFGFSDLMHKVCCFFCNCFGITYKPEIGWKNFTVYWINNCKGHSQIMLLAQLVPCLISWEIWLSKCRKKYDNIPMNADVVIFKVSNWLRELNIKVKPRKCVDICHLHMLDMFGIDLKRVLVKKPRAVKWLTPSQGFYKLNVDGSSFGNPGFLGCGGVLRDSKGDVIFYVACPLGVHTNAYAEAMAVFYGLSICWQLSLVNIEVESDSLMLVNWWNGVAVAPLLLMDIWEDIMSLMDLIGIKIGHVFREQNRVADSLAKLGSAGVALDGFDFSSLPSNIQADLLLDKQGVHSIRFH